jgi:phosphoserine phosphatase
MIRGDFGEKVMNQLLFQLFPDTKITTQAHYQKLFRNPKEAEKLHNSRNGQNWMDYCIEEYLFIRDTQGLGESYRWTSFIFMGWTIENFKNFCKDLWTTQIRDSKKDPSFVHPREPLQKLIFSLLEKNWNVKILTSSPTWAISEAAQDFGLNQNDVFGMNLKLENQLTTDQIIEPYPYGKGKVDTIFQNFHQNCDISFGDTINDLPMLQSATRIAVLFDRGNVELNEKCKELGIHVHPWI